MAKTLDEAIRSFSTCHNSEPDVDDLTERYKCFQSEIRESADAMCFLAALFKAGGDVGADDKTMAINIFFSGLMIGMEMEK